MQQNVPPSEPVGELLHRNGVYPIGRPSPEEFPPPPPEPSIGPESTATDIKQAIVACDIAKLRRIILNYREIVALTSSRSPVEADYNTLVEEWIAATMREFCFGGKRGGMSELGEPETGNYVATPAGQKWKQPVLLCEVILPKLDSATGMQANEAIRFTLVDFDHNWRILLGADP